jgi:protein-serine/threonine kinase
VKQRTWFEGESAIVQPRILVLILLISRLLTGADNRLNIDQIKSHPFFYGVDWATIRNIDAPFVPNLKNQFDTSYFPTEDLDQVPDLPASGRTGEAPAKDLAFLGYT